MDSYIEKRLERIKRLKSTMLVKYTLCVFLLLCLPIWASSMGVQAAPDTWESANISCVDISVKDEAKTPYAIIEGDDGYNYLVDPAQLTPEFVAENVHEGDECAIVYANVGESDRRVVKELDVHGEKLLTAEESEEDWYANRRTNIIAIVATIVAAGVSALLIDRIWCKNEKAEIKALKAEIAKREEKIKGKGENNKK